MRQFIESSLSHQCSRAVTNGKRLHIALTILSLFPRLCRMGIGLQELESRFGSRTFSNDVHKQWKCTGRVLRIMKNGFSPRIGSFQVFCRCHSWEHYNRPHSMALDRGADASQFSRSWVLVVSLVVTNSPALSTNHFFRR
jgi:hypothetical protein